MLDATALTGTAFAWSHAGFRGGSVSGGGGSWSGTGFRRSTASGGDGSWQAHGADGGSAYHSNYHGGSYTAYHPPTTVNTYYENGCYDCGGWNTAGAAAAGPRGGRHDRRRQRERGVVERVRRGQQPVSGGLDLHHAAGRVRVHAARRRELLQVRWRRLTEPGLRRERCVLPDHPGALTASAATRRSAPRGEGESPAVKPRDRSRGAGAERRRGTLPGTPTSSGGRPG